MLTLSQLHKLWNIATDLFRCLMIICTMFIQYNLSFSFTPFNRSIHILARPRNVTRVKAASARPVTHAHNHPIMPFHSSMNKLQPPQGRNKVKNPPSPNSPSPSNSKKLAEIDTHMQRFIPGFTRLNAHAERTALQQSTNYIAAEIRKKDPHWKPGSYGAFMEKHLAEEQEQKEGTRGADRWYKKPFRMIAWGPTIVIQFIGFIFTSLF